MAADLIGNNVERAHEVHPVLAILKQADFGRGQHTGAEDVPQLFQEWFLSLGGHRTAGHRTPFKLVRDEK